MQRYAVARVVADPPITDVADAPGGWGGVAHFRLHGAPRMYWSRYDASYLSRLAKLVRRMSESVDVWCVFDNTATGTALDNAWELQRLLVENSDSARSRSIGSTNVLDARRHPATRHIGALPRPLTPAFPIAHRRVHMALC